MPDKSDKSPNKEEDEVLDLIDDPKKMSRRERQRARVEALENPRAHRVEKAKSEALDLFSDDKSKKRKGKSDADSAKAEQKADDKAPEPAAKAEDSGSDDSSDAENDQSKLIVIKPPILVPDLAERLGLKPFNVMADLIKLGVFPAPNQPLEPEVAAQVCDMHGYTFEREKRDKDKGVHKVEEVIEEPEVPADEPDSELKTRPPIVTIMGHVDHGKTTILDYFRKSKVADGEAGGITQHIGAYQVIHNGQEITFLDTPGHAIFTQMRARGANVTDIIVIVVAANDGIKPQTKEAIEHARNAGKTPIVAINKCDLDTANVDMVKGQLAENGLQTTDYGGDTEFAEVSALNGDGMEDLLELIALQAEVLELKANPNTTTRAGVIEAKVIPGQGTTATVIVESGTLKVGMPFICGPFCGKVRSLINDRGEAVDSAHPGMPVEVIGFEELPKVGDHLTEMKSEREAKKLAAERQEAERLERLKPQGRNRMADLHAMVTEGGGKTRLNIILKGDVQGSVEAIKNAVMEIESEKVECNFITAAAGPVTESDIDYAASTDAVVIGFNVKVEAKAVKAAKAADIEVKLFSVVYELIDQVRDAMLGLLDPLTREDVIGHAEVRQVFKLNKGARAAGCYVTDGKVHRKAHARVIRDGVPVFDGKMSTLRRFQDEVQDVRTNFECGIRLGDFNEYQEGDIIECYNLEKVQQEL